MDITMVWNIPTPIGALMPGAHIGTHSLHQIVDGLGVTWWAGDRVAATVGHWDCYIVNLFPDMQHVTQIRAKQPDALIVALPDAYMDEVFLGCNMKQELGYIQQLQAADVIGYVSESNRQFYSAFGKPMVRIPMPIGTPEFFAEARLLPKEDFIISTDHSPRMIDQTVQNVAALARIQQETGLRVVYCNAREESKQYAAALGLKAEFKGHLVYEDYVRLSARARLGVDLYTLHGYGRNELTWAYCGTPFVGSDRTEMPLSCKVSPWNVDGAFYAAQIALAEPPNNSNIRWVELHNSFDAVRTQWAEVVERLQAHVPQHA